MESTTGRFVITFNGEIYNHKLLRPELERHGIAFRGHSDTEILLAAIEVWGLKGAIERFIGMFAFALWDRRDRTLTLVRDRLGIKPLYYGWAGKGSFIFGSELKALRQARSFDNPIDRGALALLLRHNYIPEPWSIYRDVYKLMPGTWLTLDADTAKRPHTPDDLINRITTYWSAKEIAERGCGSRATMNDSDAVEHLEALLRDSVALRMLADVPLGAFLSGGIDSSTVVALMQVQSARPVRTFSIGFQERGFDEAPHAKAIARHLHTDHTELYVTSREAIDVIPKLPQMYDEPFSDSSQIPTYLVSQLARRHVIVSLSGDGGDELFGGYSRYVWTQQLWKRIAHLPSFLRNAVAWTLRSMPNACSTAIDIAGPLFPRRWRVNNPREKVQRLADLLGADSPELLYKTLVSHWTHPGSLTYGTMELPTALTDKTRQAKLQIDVERMMYTDLVSYLPGDILTKVDRASMAVGLEARVPLLDHRVVEFAWQLPFDFKIRGGVSKWLLRQVLYKHVPPALFDRPKQGFGVPIGAWLRGPLRDWAEAQLDQRRLRQEGYLEPGVVRSMWSNHLTGRIDEQYRLWDVLMFQSWIENENRGHLPRVVAHSVAGLG